MGTSTDGEECEAGMIDLEYYLFGRSIFVQWDKSGWWITNQKGERHVMRFSASTTENKLLKTSSLILLRLRITIVQVKKTDERVEFLNESGAVVGIFEKGILIGKTPQFKAQMAIKPLFEERADVSISRAQAVYKQRGGEYADTWRSCRFLKMKAVSKALGIEIKPEHFRALATAAFCDMKYERNAGGYKDDSIIDGINYDAFLAEEMRELGVK